MAGNVGMTGESKAVEIRGSAKMRFLGRVGGYLFKVVGRTLRVRLENEHGEKTTIRDGDGPCIFALWHNSALIHVQCVGRARLTRKMVVLTSASRDGAALASFVEVFGFGAVRGSSSRRARAALVGSLRALKGGMSLGITPDGPRGPRYVVQPGVIKLAQLSGVPIIVARSRCSHEWHLKTWDRFRIPVPFSRVVFTIEEGIEVPRESTDAEQEEMRIELERRMRKGLDESELLENDEH